MSKTAALGQAKGGIILRVFVTREELVHFPFCTDARPGAPSSGLLERRWVLDIGCGGPYPISHMPGPGQHGSTKTRFLQHLLSCFLLPRTSLRFTLHRHAHALRPSACSLAPTWSVRACFPEVRKEFSSEEILPRPLGAEGHGMGMACINVGLAPSNATREEN